MLEHPAAVFLEWPLINGQKSGRATRMGMRRPARRGKKSKPQPQCGPRLFTHATRAAPDGGAGPSLRPGLLTPFVSSTGVNLDRGVCWVVLPTRRQTAIRDNPPTALSRRDKPTPKQLDRPGKNTTHPQSNPGKNLFAGTDSPGENRKSCTFTHLSVPDSATHKTHPGTHPTLHRLPSFPKYCREKKMGRIPHVLGRSRQAVSI